MTRIFWKDIGHGFLFLVSGTTDTKFRRSTGVTTANSTNKNPNANKLGLGDQLLRGPKAFLLHVDLDLSGSNCFCAATWLVLETSYILGESDTQPAVQLLSNDYLANVTILTNTLRQWWEYLPSFIPQVIPYVLQTTSTMETTIRNTYEGETSEHPPTTRTLPERSLSSLVSTPSLVIHTIPCVKVINTVSALTTTTSSALPPPTICILYVLVFYCNIFSHPLI